MCFRLSDCFITLCILPPAGGSRQTLQSAGGNQASTHNDAHDLSLNDLRVHAVGASLALLDNASWTNWTVLVVAMYVDVCRNCNSMQPSWEKVMDPGLTLLCLLAQHMASPSY